MAEDVKNDTNFRSENSYSFQELYLEHFNRIFAFMLARFSNREHALDCVQEVFLRFMKTNPSPDSIRGSVSSYLYGIAHNVVADFLSNSKRQKARNVELIERFPDVPGMSPIDKNRLYACLEKLNYKDKKILILHFWEGRNHQQVASELGMNYDQVRQRFHRALLKLKKNL